MTLRTEQKLQIGILISLGLALMFAFLILLVADSAVVDGEANLLVLFFIAFNTFMIGYFLTKGYKFYRFYIELKREGWRSYR